MTPKRRPGKELPFDYEPGNRRIAGTRFSLKQEDAPRPAPPTDTVAWLKWLDDDIWIEHPGTFNSYGYVKPYRALTEVEKDRVIRAIPEHKLLTTMGCGIFGLSGYSMMLYSQPDYPGLKPLALLSVTNEHWYGLDHRRDEDPRYDRLWALFSGYTHSEQNREWLRSYGFDAPRERSYYDY